MNTRTQTLCQSLRQLSGVYRAFNDTMASQLDECADRLQRLEAFNAELERSLEDVSDALSGLLEEVEGCIDCHNSAMAKFRIQTARSLLQ